MFAGCLPALAQIPFVTVMYRLFTSTAVGGHANALLGGTVFGAPLGGHFFAALAAGNVAVFLGLFVLLGALAWYSSRWQAKQAQGPALVRLLPYGTVLMASVIPLAAGIYLLVTNAWTVAERVVFYA
jgi:YidC/Oxa1 family membrane protein insertase